MVALVAAKTYWKKNLHLDGRKIIPWNVFFAHLREKHPECEGILERGVRRRRRNLLGIIVEVREEELPLADEQTHCLVV